ncbi:MAG TPA: hypothetical protein VHF25_01825 [Nitriliruptorales bacterium]|nr:hypothetical protein [Nitriliruptorales bacterium]
MTPWGDPAQQDAPVRQPLPLVAGASVALLGLATGAGLLVFFLTGRSPVLGVVATVALAGSATTVVRRRLSSPARQAVRRRAWAGVRAGLLATVVYDVTRLLVVQVTAVPVRPFEAVPLFGQVLVGASSGSVLTDALGVAYHVANGIGFGFAYALVAGSRGLFAGIAWALVLEALLLAFYPGWLDVRAGREFVSVSMLGHLAYGAALGWSAKVLLEGGGRGPRPDGGERGGT